MAASLTKSVLLFWEITMGTTLSEQDCATQGLTACHLCKLYISALSLTLSHASCGTYQLLCSLHSSSGACVIDRLCTLSLRSMPLALMHGVLCKDAQESVGHTGQTRCACGCFTTDYSTSRQEVEPQGY